MKFTAMLKFNILVKLDARNMIEYYILYQRVDSTLYVGMAHQAPSTNIKLRIDFLLTRPRKALCKDSPAKNIRFED